MTQAAVSIAQRNTEHALRLLDALRNNDLDALDDLVAEDYAQHNPQAGNGRQAMKDFFGSVGPLDIEVHRTVAEGSLVAVHSHLKSWDMAAMDIFRFSPNGRVVEHWDVLQPVPATTVSGNDMFTQAG